FTVISDNVISATAPTGGGQDVTVTTPGGTSQAWPGDRFWSQAIGVPIITQISPAAGSTSGGTTVIITGQAFNGATSVNFGITPATSYTVNSTTQITAVAPAHAAGQVDIFVTNSSHLTSPSLPS